jgi:hypothetical protein
MGRKRDLIFVIFLLFSSPLLGSDTSVEAANASYNGEIIHLQGDVAIENEMGRITAQTAKVKKESGKESFAWAELEGDVIVRLSDGGKIQCEKIFCDLLKKTTLLIGKVIYTDESNQVLSAIALIDYREENGNLVLNKITLKENVQLILHPAEEPNTMQYALADLAIFFPKEGRLLLESREKNRVLFFDPSHQMQLKAKAIEAKRDPVNKRDSVQGVGDVHFVFGPEELERIKRNFKWHS